MVPKAALTTLNNVQKVMGRVSIIAVLPRLLAVRLQTHRGVDA